VRPAVALVVAKAPVAGRVKTRLGQVVGMERAAGLAAAALLDTLSTCVEAYGVERCHLALDGDLKDAHHADELLEAVAGWSVHSQRGEGFAERLVHAHWTVAVASGAPVVQVGMDTPQLSVATLRSAAALLTARDQAVLGQAHDGGWWLMGLGGPHLLAHLGDVPMSTSETGELTRLALTRAGATVHETESLRDVDVLADAESVATAAPETRFARQWR
jgi:glycosyltransferase A (GT-A) superfamily protein (DUF2064 family)